MVPSTQPETIEQYTAARVRPMEARPQGRGRCGDPGRGQGRPPRAHRSRVTGWKARFPTPSPAASSRNTWCRNSARAITAAAFSMRPRSWSKLIDGEQLPAPVSEHRSGEGRAAAATGCSPCSRPSSSPRWCVAYSAAHQALLRSLFTGGAAGGVAWLLSSIIHRRRALARRVRTALRAGVGVGRPLRAPWRLGRLRWRRRLGRRWFWRRRWLRRRWRLVRRWRHVRRRRRLGELVMRHDVSAISSRARPAHLFPGGQPAAHRRCDRRRRAAAPRRNLFRGGIGACSAAWCCAACRRDARAEAAFARLRVWDTAANNGVLIYLLLADHRIEIVADRGLNGLVSAEQWRGVCQLMEERLQRGRAGAGVLCAASAAVSDLLAEHFPQTTARRTATNCPTCRRDLLTAESRRRRHDAAESAGRARLGQNRDLPNPRSAA